MMPEPLASPAPIAAPLHPQAEVLVRQFYQRFHGLAQVTPSPKELEHATALLAQHGAAQAHFLLAFAHQEAPATDYTPRVFGGMSVRLRVNDDGDTSIMRPATSPGYGLIGMSERAGLLGGTCEAGPDPERGWTVTAVLPRAGWAR